MATGEDPNEAFVIGPNGEALTLDTLPPAGRQRWVIRRKAEVVAAVNGGLLKLEEALHRYNITIDEFAGWIRAVERSGLAGLRVTRAQYYRDRYEREERVLLTRAAPAAR